jgi:ankyrin repeat protein
MSDDARPDLAQPNLARPNLAQQRKRAKDLRRAHQRGDADAAARIIARLPSAAGRPVAEVLATPVTLSEAQLVVAREAGFPTWTRLKHELVRAGVDAVVDAALAGDPFAAAALAADPALPRGSLPLAAAVGADEAALALLAERPERATRPDGPRGWTPLLYVCSARFGRGDPAVAARRVRIAARLLDLGADPNEDVDSYEARHSPLRNAVREAASVELVDLLLRAGAGLAPTDASAGRDLPLVDAVVGGNPACVARILAAGPPWWQAREALEAAVFHDDAASARLLLAYGAHPSAAGRWWGNLGSCLHAAILLGRGGPLLEALLDSDVDLAAVDRDGRTAYAVAVRTGHDVATALRERAPSAAGLDDVDRVIAACVRLDRLDLDRRLAARPDVSTRYRYTDHLMLGWAIRRRRFAAVPLLLAAGLDPDVADPDGETPLHLAAAGADPATIAALLAGGASPSVRNFRGATPFDSSGTGTGFNRTRGTAGTAGPPGTQRERDVLFERAADAVAAGDLAALRLLLDGAPWLVHARSPREHRATLLHYCAANGTEAPRQRTPPTAAEVARLLLDRGSDVDAAARFYGGGAGATTLALTLTSVHPAEAGIDGELVRVLTGAGARLDLWTPGEPMFWCVERGTHRGARALAEAGLPLDNLLLAAAANRIDTLAELLAAGADVNERHRDGYTALHAAAVLGHAEAVAFLLDRGADPRVRETAHGGTPAGKAHWRGHHELAALIEARAAD